MVCRRRGPHSPRVKESELFGLARELPDAVSLSVECPEEPYEPPLQPGDIEIRFHPRGPYDVSELDVVVEVRSKWFASRGETRQEKCDRLRDVIVQVVDTASVGVYLTMPVAAWPQSG